MSESALLANVLYVFAAYVQASVEEGLLDAEFLARTHEVQDLALKYLLEEFDAA